MLRFVGIVLSGMVLVGGTGGVALALVGGKTVPISAAPWSVVLRRVGSFACGGVIVDPRHVLTAEHCVMYGDSLTPLPPAAFTIEAGVSNFIHPLKSDRPQFRKVIAERLLAGYIGRVTYANSRDAVGHDLAVLTLSRPLDLSGNDARRAYLPNRNTPAPWGRTRLVIAGFGNEKPEDGVQYANGTLNEVSDLSVFKACDTARTLCVLSAHGPCSGDSGSGLVEPGPRPTVVGILSEAQTKCGICGRRLNTGPPAPVDAPMSSRA